MLAEDDPEKDFGSGAIQYPLTFWKVVCIADPDEHPRGEPALQVFGFLLNQRNVVDEFGIERFDPGSFRRYLRPLDEIEQVAGVVFDRALHRADTKARR